jgi:DNA helicase II / ATP-dependent DNA helicase PcrA
MSSYLAQLNTIQRQAVEAIEGPVLVVAGPGSGKTRVLTYRIAHIIEKGVSPSEILALTFTNKAAREMGERIEKVVGPQAKKVWAGTFHSIFARILRVEAEKIGYPSNFTIYDTEDTKNVLGAILKEMSLDKNVYNINTIRSRISSAKSSLITPRLYAQNEEFKLQDRQAKMPYLAEIYLKYGERCKRAGAMDFDDLLYRLYELWQTHPEVLETYRQRFRYIMVDEFQDTNTLQYSIIRKLINYEGSPRNICVVGDDAQSIYAFRGATIQNILDYESDYQKFQIQVFKLEENYRSTEHIVQAANEVIRFNRKQIQKKIWSSRGEGHKIKVIKTMTDAEEGKRVADTILEQRNRYHLRNGEIAVLYRTNSQSRIMEEYLRRYNIPYRVFGGLSFYQRKEVKDLIAYLRLSVNPRDEEALRRVINFPKRGIGDGTVDKISEIAGQQGITMWECLEQTDFGPRTQKGLTDFMDMIKKFMVLAKEKNAYESARLIAHQSKLVEEYNQDKTVEGLGRMENLNALLDGINSFVEDDEFLTAGEQTDKNLATYLQNIALVTDQDNDKDNNDHVTLMSVHSAKGLEFKSVFVVGLEEKLFPSLMAQDSPDGIDEERRLFYVAITRAELFLTLTFALSRYKFGQMTYSEMSRFIEEIPKDHLESTAALRGGLSSDWDPKPSAKPGAPAKSGVSGVVAPKPKASIPAVSPRVDMSTFKPSPSESIEAGMKVIHLKFGEGNVLSIEGGKDNRLATINFPFAEDSKEKKIMLKFAKLMIVE